MRINSWQNCLIYKSAVEIKLWGGINKEFFYANFAKVLARDGSSEKSITWGVCFLVVVVVSKYNNSVFYILDVISSGTDEPESKILIK